MKFKLDALVNLYLQENSDEEEKGKWELLMCSKDLDNTTYNLLKKLGRYKPSCYELVYFVR